MPLGTSIFLVAVGAILRYAVTAHISGVSITTVGLILMIAGAAGLLLSFFQDAIWSDRRRRREAALEERADPRELPPRY
jgi:hypothetical protein